jgi:hypothetical protein
MMMDATGRLAGRGAYLCVDPACRHTALTKNILSRALGMPLPDDLRSELEATDRTPERSAGVDQGRTPERRARHPGEGAAMTRRTAHELGNEPDLTNTPGGTIGQE